MSEKKSENKRDTADQMILGRNAIYSTDCHQTGLNNNVIVAGTSGAGKTMSVTVPCLMTMQQGSGIVSMTKKKVAQMFEPVFRQRGYEVQTLDLVHPTEGTVGFDLLAGVETHEDITFLARSIVMSNPRKEHSTADPYWDESSVSLLSALIAVVLKREEHSFADVLDLMAKLRISDGSGSSITTTLDGVFTRLEERRPRDFAVNCWKSFRELPEKTARCVYGTLQTTLDTLFTPQIRQMMRTKGSVDFRGLAEHRTMLFVLSSPVNSSLNFFLNLFFAQAIKSLFEYAEGQPDGTLPIPVRILCDDFATGGRIQDFPEYISIIREKQISVTLLIQSESQLSSMYGDNAATTIINNCDTYLYLGGMDLRTAQSISIRLNAPLDEVLYLPVGREVVLRRGQRPKVTDRYPIMDDPRFAQIREEYEQGIARQKEEAQKKADTKDGGEERR